MSKIHKFDRRWFGLTGAAAVVTSLTYLKRNSLRDRLQAIEFNALERSAPMRREVWPIEHRSTGWEKCRANPVLGGDLGVCFDVSVLQLPPNLHIWFSWRSRGGIGHAVSADGITWKQVEMALPPFPSSKWRTQVNRPKVIRIGNVYKMWYTGQTRDNSAIGMAESENGIDWKDVIDGPVFVPQEAWEHGSVMTPDVMWDETRHVFRMWYSAGGQFEPVAIGYAESSDGISWKRHNTPIFSAAQNGFDCARVTAASVIQAEGRYLLFYVGFRNIEEAAICLARSIDGISNWERHPLNPILLPGENTADWDFDAVYKPSVIRLEDRWMLWYNGRRGSTEQIGLAVHPGLDLGFPLTDS